MRRNLLTTPPDWQYFGERGEGTYTLRRSIARWHSTPSLTCVQGKGNAPEDGLVESHDRFCSFGSKIVCRFYGFVTFIFSHRRLYYVVHGNECGNNVKNKLFVDVHAIILAFLRPHVWQTSLTSRKWWRSLFCNFYVWLFLTFFTSTVLFLHNIFRYFLYCATNHCLYANTFSVAKISYRKRYPSLSATALFPVWHRPTMRICTWDSFAQKNVWCMSPVMLLQRAHYQLFRFLWLILKLFASVVTNLMCFH